MVEVYNSIFQQSWTGLVLIFAAQGWFINKLHEKTISMNCFIKVVFYLCTSFSIGSAILLVLWFECIISRLGANPPNFYSAEIIGYRRGFQYCELISIFLLIFSYAFSVSVKIQQTKGK